MQTGAAPSPHPGGPADLGLVTPEGVPLHIRRAGPATRMLARLVDLLVQAVVFLAVALAVGVAGGVTGTAAAIAYLVAVPVIIFGYPAAMETLWRGRTLGKAAMGLRVLTTDGAPIRFRHALIRSVLWLVDGLLLTPAVGVLMLILTKDTVRLGDLAAGTMVVRERSGARMPSAVAFTPPPGLEHFAAQLDVARVTPADYEVIRSILLRSGELPPYVYWDVSQRVAVPLAQRLAVHIPQGIRPDAFLQCVAAAYQWRSGGWGGSGGQPIASPPPVASPPPAAPPPAAASPPPAASPPAADLPGGTSFRPPT